MLTYKPFQGKKKQRPLEKGRKEKLEKKYMCRACGKPLTWVEDTNIMSCQNPKCKGIKKTKKKADGTESVYYTMSYMTLNNYDRRLIERINGK